MSTILNEYHTVHCEYLYVNGQNGHEYHECIKSAYEYCSPEGEGRNNRLGRQ